VTLWLRFLVFLVLGPGMLAVYVPQLLRGAAPMRAGAWPAGWLLIAAGAVCALAGMRSFLAAGGTPAIFFTRPLRAIWGTEPPSLVRQGLYRYTRNPMYAGVVAVILGQAIVFRSLNVAFYGLAMFVLFHLTVTLIEEPHLRARDPEAFARFTADVPRWFGWRRKQATPVTPAPLPSGRPASGN
jgi:protein-S-isoprenylcysteine O-methyltransferase Ste14